MEGRESTGLHLNLTENMAILMHFFGCRAPEAVYETDSRLIVSGVVLALCLGSFSSTLT